MPSSIWDHCFLDDETLAIIDKIPCETAHRIEHSKTSDDASEKEIIPSSSSAARAPNHLQIYELQESVMNAEQSCRQSLSVLDDIIKVLGEVSSAYEDVTGRTNSLMVNCEQLLEQQRTYQQTVGVLSDVLQPFNDIEQVASLLGIPFDPQGYSLQKPNNSRYNAENLSMVDTGVFNMDPRSPEFKNILNRLADAADFLKSHDDIMESKRYQEWLEKLKHRATSLIGRAMREFIEKANKTCGEIYQQKIYRGGNVFVIEDQPVESAAVYQKFRGLSYRLRELSALLLRGNFAKTIASTENTVSNTSGNSSSRGRDVPVLAEVKEYYVSVRNELLLPFIKETWLSALAVSGTTTNTTSLAGINVSLAVETSLGGRKLVVPSASTIDNGIINGINTGGGIQVGNLPGGSGSATDTVAGATPTIYTALGTGIRQAYSILLRITQLELQLFESLFSSTASSSSLVEDGNNGSTPSISRQPSADSSDATNSADFGGNISGNNSGGVGSQHVDSEEVLSIIETLSNATRDFLRPYIIHESQVDELCRVVSALSEDVRSQMTAMPAPPLLLKQLLRGLDGTVSDAKERLAYCAVVKIRHDVQLFEPRPSHLSYPDILESFAKYQAKANGNHKLNSNNSSTTTISTTVGSGTDGDDDGFGITDVYGTWYPPMRHTLSLLSKLYGVVETNVFEDFASRAIDMCVVALKAGSEGVKRTRPGLHGDLFLVSHLLTLREQLVPFELRLQSVERHLDFSSTTTAVSSLMQNTQSLWRLDQDNAILQMARQGVPRMLDTTVDVKRDLDAVLKSACFSFKHAAVKNLLGPMDAFLVKVGAFVGDIPTSFEPTAQQSTDNANGIVSANSSGLGAPNQVAVDTKTNGSATLANADDGIPLLPSASSMRLKSQSFVRPERIKEMLESVQAVLLHRVPDLKQTMKLYVDNSIARTILLKPVLQEFDEAKRKMECILKSCQDPGQVRRDLESQLQTISMTVVADLAHAS